MANDLREKNRFDKKVILHITSAYGFGLIKGSITIQATFRNKTLKTPDIFVDNNELKFDSKLVWCMTNEQLKCLKMSCASVKVECFHKPINEPNASLKLGYLFLQVKGAQTICPKSNDRIDRISYKLIGSKYCNYSLTMSLRIEDFCSKPAEISHTKTKKLNNIDKNIVNNNINNLYSHKDEKKKEIEEGKNEIGDKIDSELPKNYLNMFADQTEKYTDANKSQNDLNSVVRQKLIELYHWENEQKSLFFEQMKKKEEKLLKEFNQKWSEDRKIIENELLHEISKCRAVTESMNKIVDELNEQKSMLMSKEEPYNLPVISELNQKITELENTNVLLRIENDQLGKKVLDLEKACEEGYKSSMFFKERWIKCVRKINQIYEKQYQHKSLDDINYKQNIDNVLTTHAEERRHDQEKSRQILYEFSKLRQELI